MSKELTRTLLMAGFKGFFIGAVLFMLAVLVGFIFSAVIIVSSPGDMLLLFLCSWLIGSVSVLVDK